MKKYSGIYKKDGFSFRYDFQRAMVEYVQKADKSYLDDNAEWMAEFGKPLWDIDDSGYIVIDAVGLRPDNWKNKELRDDYLSEWIYEMREAVAYEMQFDLI